MDPTRDRERRRIVGLFKPYRLRLSVVLGLIVIAAVGFWRVGLALFVLGWVFQFVGHAFEGKPPEFFHDWRFLFVGLRWWVAKMRGRA